MAKVNSKDTLSAHPPSVVGPSSNELRPLPEGWVWTTLGESCDIVLGQSPSSDTYNADGIGLPFYQGKAEFGDLYPTPEKWCSSPKKIAEENDILITVRAPVGPTNLCPEKSCIGRGLAAIRPRNGMPTKFFLYFLRYIEKEWDSKATGTTFKAITGDVLRNQEMPLPPLPEQERIVARLEELLSDLDAGVVALERVHVGAKRYKVSVLKAAVEGKLFESRGTESSESGLPEGWRWVRIDEVTENFDGKRVPVKASDRENMAGEYPYYGASGIIDHVNDYLFDGNYLLIAEDGANLLSRSTPIAFQAHGKFWVNNHAHIVKTIDDMPLGYLEIFLNSLDLKFYITGTAQPKLTQANMNKIPVPVPSLEEQRRIVAEVERRLEAARAVESAIEAGLKRARRLRQAVLRSALEGRL